MAGIYEINPSKSLNGAGQRKIETFEGAQAFF
jgi:hypothetical protein